MILAIVDVETTGLDPRRDVVIEVGCVLWSVDCGCVVSAWSDLVRPVVGARNDAEAVNGIRVEAAALGLPGDVVLRRLRSFVGRADALVAHPSSFESRWLPDLGKPWVCSMHEVRWPRRPEGGRSLANLALAHGVQVAQAHRALVDCLLLAQTLEAAARMGMDVRAEVERVLARR